MSGWRDRLADELIRTAAWRVRRRYPDWADAMLSEHISLSGAEDQFEWAFGSLRASFGLPLVVDGLYVLALLGGVAAMALYQWSADEGLITLAVLSALALGLGLLKPAQSIISGVALGAVVTAVNGFETLSGLRPDYEIHAHSLMHDLRWMVLIIPALASSALGRRIRRRFSA